MVLDPSQTYGVAVVLEGCCSRTPERVGIFIFIIYYKGATQKCEGRLRGPRVGWGGAPTRPALRTRLGHVRAEAAKSGLRLRVGGIERLGREAAQKKTKHALYCP